MKILRLLGVVLLGCGLALLLQLPDAAGDRPERHYARLPEPDLAALAMQTWLAGRKGEALLLLDYAAEQPYAEFSACAQLRASYLTALREDTTPGGALVTFGLTPPAGRANSYQELAGQSVADYFSYGGGARAAQAAAGGRPDRFQTLLQETRESVTAVFAPAAPALALASAAHARQALGDTLVSQISQALQFVQAEPTNTLAAFAVQESVMPILQLARPCKSWTIFQLLLRNAGSVDQVKLLTRMATATPESARKLARVLAVAGAAPPGLESRCLEFVMQQGVAGLDNLHAALAKGVAGLQLVLNNPVLPAAALNGPVGGAAARPDEHSAWWLGVQGRYGRTTAMAFKYALVALVCAALLGLLVPWRVFRDTFAPATPLAGLGTGPLLRAYGLAIVLGAAAACLLLMLPAVTPPLAAGPEQSAKGGAGAGGAAAAAVTTPERSQAASLILLLLAILIVQGGCYWLARRKLREVDLGTTPGEGEREDAAGAALKLRRLENLDIFFDLPLYCGLALTIFAFLLITTLGAGISRFLAYGSTFVGIVFSVILRVVYLYPLREKLLRKATR